MSTGNAQNPGLRQQSGVRTALRVLGLVMAPVGVVLLVVGFYRFVTFDSDTFYDGTPPGFLMFALGGVLAVVGFGLLSAGFMGATARYSAGETMPVVKDSATYLSDGEGVLGVGRTVDDAAAPTAEAGPFCRKCGAHNDGEASFCDHCGAALA